MNPACQPLPIFFMNQRRNNVSMFCDEVRRAAQSPKVPAKSDTKSIAFVSLKQNCWFDLHHINPIINFTNIINFIMDIMGRGLVDRDKWLWEPKYKTLMITATIESLCESWWYEQRENWRSYNSCHNTGMCVCTLDVSQRGI